MTDITAFNEILDSHPDDFETALVFADALEDAGEVKLAAAYRWCARERKRPLVVPVDHSWLWSNKEMWAGYDHGDELPAKIFDLLEEASHSVIATFPTRHAAMLALAEALD